MGANHPMTNTFLKIHATSYAVAVVVQYEFDL